MQTEDLAIKPVRPVYLKDPLNRDQGRSDGSFQQVLEKQVSRKNAKMPKKARAEFTGILDSCNISVSGSQVCHFQLETHDSDLLLRTEGHLLGTAKKYLWDEVRVRGYFDDTGMVLNVESIVPVHVDDEAPLYLSDSDWEVDRFRKRILRDRSIEPSVEHLAS